MARGICSVYNDTHCDSRVTLQRTVHFGDVVPVLMCETCQGVWAVQWKRGGAEDCMGQQRLNACISMGATVERLSGRWSGCTPVWVKALPMCVGGCRAFCIVADQSFVCYLS